jgi:3-methyl-2-oxobutanoate hydroxymethyltransferase
MCRTISDILVMKNKSKISVLTCYDYAFAQILDEAGIDILLVGDSMANVVLGMEKTNDISVAEMVNHTKAVALGAKNALVVADMPYLAYQKDPSKALANAKKFIKAGAKAVKIEWFNGKIKSKDCPWVIKTLIKNKIPVMGHIGLTPQTAHLIGGFKVQGKDKDSALNLLNQARLLDELGCFSIVLECLPFQLAGLITKKIKIPTISCGAGVECDGQVLVLYDLLGLYKKIRPKFVKVYKDLYSDIKSAVSQYISETNQSQYPSLEQSFSLKNEEWEQILKELK